MTGGRRGAWTGEDQAAAEAALAALAAGLGDADWEFGFDRDGWHAWPRNPRHRPHLAAPSAEGLRQRVAAALAPAVKS